MKILVLDDEGYVLLKMKMRDEGDWVVTTSRPVDDRVLSLGQATEKVEQVVWPEMIKRFKAALPRKF